MACDICKTGFGLREVEEKKFVKDYYAPYILLNHQLSECPTCGGYWLCFLDPSTSKARQEEVIDPVNDLEEVSKGGEVNNKVVYSFWRQLVPLAASVFTGAAFFIHILDLFQVFRLY